MQKNQIEKFAQTYKKGTYVSVCYQTTNKKGDNVYTKTVKSIFRLVNFANTQEGQQAKIERDEKIANGWTSSRKNYDTQYIKDICVYNTNTNKYKLQLIETKGKHHRKVVVYARNGQVIEKQEYVNLFPSQPNKDKRIFVAIDNVISLGDMVAE